MISPQEIRSVTFDKVMRGYRTEDVDAFLQQIAQDMEQLAAEKADKEKKLYILAEKIEEYRRDEDNLKTALLNAQRMGESVIREAKQKAESILREAGIRADTLTRMAQEQCEEEQQELERIKGEVAQFKNTLLAIYKQHIELISNLPGEEQTDSEIPQEEFVEQPETVQLAEEEEIPVQEPVEEPPVQKEAEEVFSDLVGAYEEQEPIQQNSDVVEDPVEQLFHEEFNAPTEEPVQTDSQMPSFQGFKGIQFTD